MQRFAYIAIYVFGWTLGKAPVACVAALCRVLGWFAWHFSARRQTVLGGLARAFPLRDEAWRERIGRENSRRLFEMFLLILALPHWGERKQRRRLRLEDSMRALIEGPGRQRPLVFLIPHAALTESIAILPALHPDCPEIVTLYRPLDSPAAERYVHRARETWGLKLVSRREGLLRAKQQLQAGRGAAAILFDQSAGSQGHLMLFFDRVCSTTNLPGLLAAKTGALPVMLRMRREGFWRGILEAHPLPESTQPGLVMAHAHIALEKLLSEDDDACADWFWAHKRWKGTLRPPQFFAFPERKSYLREQLRLLGLGAIPRTSRFVLWLDPRREILPAARRFAHLLRERRPDAEIWILVPATLASESLPPHDRRLELPDPPVNRRAFLRDLAKEYPDALFVFDNRRDATADARLLPCDLAVGVTVAGAPRKVYRRSVTVTDAEYRKAPLAVWRKLFAQLGLPPEPVGADPRL